LQFKHSCTHDLLPKLQPVNSINWVNSWAVVCFGTTAPKISTSPPKNQAFFWAIILCPVYPFCTKAIYKKRCANLGTFFPRGIECFCALNLLIILSIVCRKCIWTLNILCFSWNTCFYKFYRVVLKLLRLNL